MDMNFSGEFSLSRPRQEVFRILSDPEKFAPLLPTYQSVEMMDDRTAILKVKVGIGRISSTALTHLTLEEAEEPRRARYTGKGRLMQGAFEMETAFELEEAADGTLVKWRGETRLAGKILSLAGGGLHGYAEKQMTRLIASLQQAMTPGFEPHAEEQPTPEGWLRRVRRSFAARPEAAPARRAGAWAGANDELAPAPEALRKEKLEARKRIDSVLNVRRVERKLRRKEDDRLVRGRGLFVDDYRPHGLLHMSLVRSPYAHARIVKIDLSKAETLPGVAGTLTGEEVATQCDPFPQIGSGPSANIKDYPLAVGKVRYQGDPVVAVFAETPRLAADAAQLVDVEYEVLPPVVSVEQALEDEIVLHDEAGTNTTYHDVFEYGDVNQAFKEAAHVVKIENLYFHRFGSTALETNAVVATWDPRGEIDLFSNNIMVIPLMMLATALRVSFDQIRLRTHDIGGSFGNKVANYPYMGVAALASRKAGGRPVKWVEIRSEHMQAGGHGSERSYYDTEVALDKDGVVTALRSRHVDDCGAFPRYEPLGSVIWSQVLPASYKLRSIRIDFSQVMTNKGPSTANRGYSRTPHIWFMERVIDICAHELGIPADEMRLRNYIPELPYTTPNGCVYDSGDFPAMLAKAKELIDWEGWKKKQAEARAEGRLIGIGIGTTLDSGTNNWSQAKYINPHAPFSGNSEAASIKLDLDGSVVVTIGSFPQGQGHETTAAQVVAEALGINPDAVHVRTGFDTRNEVHTLQSGTYASRFAVMGLSAVHGAAMKLKDEMKKLAAFALEAGEDDLEFGSGAQGPGVRVKGTDRTVNYWMLSSLVNSNSSTLPEGLRDLQLSVRHVFRPPLELPDFQKKYGNLSLTYALQLHIAVVEVEPRTYRTKILDYAIVDDCGKVINHMIVQGQVHGAAAHGLGAAMLEIMPFDAEGNVLSGSFTDYTPLTIQNMPDLKCSNMESPSPFTFNGAKGMGEGGGAPLLSICAALQDALYEERIIIRNAHNSPMALFQAVRDAARDNVVSVQSR